MGNRRLDTSSDEDGAVLLTRSFGQAAAALRAGLQQPRRRGSNEGPLLTMEWRAGEDEDGVAALFEAPADFSLRYSERIFTTRPGGELWCGDVLEVIMTFVVAHRPSLFAMAAVSHAWRERVEFLPQWLMLEVREPRQVVSGAHAVATARRVRQLVAASTGLDAVAAFDDWPLRGRTLGEFVAIRVATEQALMELAHLRHASAWQHGVAVGVRSLILGLILTGVTALLMFISWKLGTSPAVALKTDAQIGCAQFSVALLSLWPVRYVLQTQMDRTRWRRSFRRVSIAALTLCNVCFLVVFAFGMALSLLGHRYRDAELVASVPLYTPTACPLPAAYAFDLAAWAQANNGTNSWASGNAGSGSVHPAAPGNVTRAPLGPPVARTQTPFLLQSLIGLGNYTFATAVATNFTLVVDAATDSYEVLFSYFLMLGPRCDANRTRGAFALLAPRVVPPVTAAEMDWPPRLAGTTDLPLPVFLRTPASTTFFERTEPTVAMRWFDASVNPLWQIDGIPLVGPVPSFDSPALRVENVMASVHNVIYAAVAIFGAAALTFLAPRKRVASCLSVIWLAVVLLTCNLLTTAVVGGICWRHNQYAWCLMSPVSGLLLMGFSVLTMTTVLVVLVVKTVRG